jgi:hypothetical protein
MSTKEKILRPDSKGRITLGGLAKNISGFKVIEESNGRIVLEPQVEIPAEEAWLYKNPEALASVLRGIEDSKAGRVKYRGSFAKYLDEDEED